MYTLDLRNVQPKEIYPLGEKFTGVDPSGRELSFTNYYMTLDGKPFFGISGEMHFSRVDPDQWEDAVVKMKCGGVNMIATYVFWNVHEEEQGVFRFDGCRDLRRFLEICEKHGMLVIVRVGPFDHGEMRNGGLPDWLYGMPYDVRELNSGFLGAARRLFREVHGQMDGHYYSQGGCVVAAQLDNEYEHAGAPWEMTTGVSNEWVPAGSSGKEYLLAVKRIMREEGIVTPFYTCTGWGSSVPVEEALPLWGGYSYRPWLFYRESGVHPATEEYIYRASHSDALEEGGGEGPERPYACCEMMGGMMCSYRYRFQLDMRAVDALANIKLGSGCNLLGYYMYKGGTNPTGLRTPFLGESQVSKRTYDYQAALGEFGQVRESYGRLRAIHLFCGLFSGFLEKTRVVLPEHLADLRPEDLGPLRFCVRAAEGRGFLFVNNFQDHIAMRDRSGDEVTLRLPDGDVRFRFDIAAGENAILPFNMPMGGVTLRWATAMPLARVEDTWFFLAPDGMEPRYCFRAEDGEKRIVSAERGGSFAHADMTVVTLSRRDSLGFNVLEMRGRRAAVLCDQPLLWDGKTLSVELSEGGADVLAFPADILDLPEGAKAVRNGVFAGYRLESGREIVPAAFRTVGRSRYTVDLPEGGLAGHKEVLLRLRYRGDIGNAFVRGQLISDNLSNDGPWDVRVDSYAAELETDPLTIYITPIREEVVYDVSAMAGQKERVGAQVAELLSAQWLFVDDHPVRTR